MLRPVIEHEIISIINNLDSTKACGPNNIPNRMLKNFSDSFAKPLTSIINRCFEMGIFPNLLKPANVIPVYKKEEKTLCCNYRPISLLSNISKIFEKTMHQRVYLFLEARNLIYAHQYGVRRQHSTNHAVLNIIEAIKRKLDSKTFVWWRFP